MAPVEIDVIPRDVVAAPVAHLKIVDKAFELPLIDDTYNEASRLAAPLSPFVETVKENVEKVIPMLESGFITIKSQAEENLFPQLTEATTANIQAKLDTAKEKLASAVDSLDSLACEGLDKLTAKVPALKEATPELLETAKDTTVTYAEYAKEYVASFSLAQIALKLGDKGLQIATDALTLAGLDETKPFKPVLSGIKTIRRNARAVRRAGAKVAGIEAAKTIGEASLLGAVAEIVGLNFFLSVVGLQLVPANMQSNAKTTELDTTVEEETGDKLSNDRIASYVSDEDPDFVPSDASADSAEDDSEGEEAIVEVLEEVQEKIEDAVEEVVKEIEDDVKEVVKEIEDVIEEVVEEIEDVVEEVANTIKDVVEEIADKIEDLVLDVEDDVEEAGKSDEDVVEVKADKTEEIADKTEDIDVEDVEEADEELD